MRVFLFIYDILQILYRLAAEDVPVGDFELPLGKAETVRSGQAI